MAFKRLNIAFYFILGINFSVWCQEILIPAAGNVKDKILFSKTEKTNVGIGFFPVSYNEANYALPTKNTTLSWVRRKIFAKHFLQKTGEKFFLAIDPLVNMSIGKDVSQENQDYLYQNTRGAQVFGQLKDKLSFYTAFYENQARFITYQSDYFIERGEFYPYKGTYIQNNAVIPNGGRTKPFKTNGFDYASAVSYVRLMPLKQLTFQLGNAPRFYGWGHRSLLLSDNSYNYTNLTVDWKITKRLVYTFVRGKQLNLIRKVHTNMVEAPYERKGIGIHYLSYQPIPSLTIGVFEATVYLRDEATSSQRVNPYFYQPLIGINTIANGEEISDLKNLIGLNLGWRFHSRHMIYIQAITDDLNHFEYGFQFGYRTGNTFGVENLRFQLEYNQASDRLYAANNQRMAYTHFNLPLAHTLGNGFKEVITRASYEWKKAFVELGAVYYQANQPIDDKSNLFQSKQVIFPQNKTTVLNGNVTLGYLVNPATQLRIFVSANYRTSASDMGKSLNHGAVYFGLRSALNNQYFDF